MSTWTIELPFTDPPLRSNQRLHWAKKAELTRKCRSAAAWTARAHRVRRIEGPVIVSLVWVVTSKHRRDAGASSPTLKACLDGIVDANVLSSDDHTVVVEERCRIEHGEKPGVRIEVTPT